MSFVLELLRMMDGDDLQVVWKVSGLGAQREGLGSELAAEQALAWWRINTGHCRPNSKQTNNYVE